MKNRFAAVSLGILIGIAPCLHASFELQTGSARSQGLGGAMTGLSDSSDAVFYNPAGLSQLTHTELNGTYGKLYMGLDDSSNLSNSNVSYAYPTRRNGTFAAGLNIFALQGSYSETIGGLYYGKKVSKKMALGGGVKYMSIAYGTDEYTAINPVFDKGTSRTNMSFDAGLMYFANKKWTLGLAMKDLNQPDMGLKYPDPVKQSISVGAAYREKNLNIVTDINTKGSGFKFITGAEKWFMLHSLAVRGALGFGSKNYLQGSVGVGYRGENVGVDYALLYPLSGLSETYGTHEVSFGYRFGSPQKVYAAEAKKSYDKVMTTVKTGDYAQALKDANQAVEDDPTSQKYQQTKERLEAINNAVTQAKGKEKTEEAIRRGITKYLVEEDPRMAVNILLYAYSLKKDNPDLYTLTKAIAKENGVPLQELIGGWNLAEQKVYQALEKFKSGKYYECIELCQEALEYEPNNATAYKRLGSAYYILKKMDLAEKNWEKAIKLAPNDEDNVKIKKLLDNIKAMK